MWADPKIEGVLSAVPYLKKFGVTPENLIYKFDFKGTHFVYLWSDVFAVAKANSPDLAALWSRYRYEWTARMRNMWR